MLQQVGVKYYACNVVAWKMYNIKFLKDSTWWS